MKKYIIKWFNIINRQEEQLYIKAENDVEAKKNADFLIKHLLKARYRENLIGEIKEIKDEEFLSYDDIYNKYGEVKEILPVINTNVKVNKNCVNAKIKANILSENKMREIGFTDYGKTNWFFSRGIKFPKEKRYSGFDISFQVSIPKNGDDIRIDVLDEDFCQPYDYQKMLNENPDFEPALIVREQVEEWMEYLQKNNVLSGHIRGEYI